MTSNASGRSWLYRQTFGISVETFLFRTVVWMWVAMVLAISIRVMVSNPLKNSVFPIYQMGAERWEERSDLYAPPPKHLDVYRYHPVFAAALVPSLSIEPKLASLLWRWLNLGIFIAGFYSVMRLPAFYVRMNNRSRPVAWGLIIPLVLQSFNNAQANLGMAGVLMLATTSAILTRYSKAAGWLMFAVMFKVYPIVLGCLFCLIVPIQFFPRFIVMLVLLMLSPYLFAEATYVTEQYSNWLNDLQTDSSRQLADLERAPRDAFLLLRVWFSPPSMNIYRSLQACIGLLIAIWLLVQRNRLGRADRLFWAFIFGTLWMVIFGPATESSTYTLLAPICILAWFSDSRIRWQRISAILGWAFIAMPSLVTAFPWGKQVQYWGPQPFGGLLLILSLLPISRKLHSTP
jgi:hypothetical protein